MMAARKSLRDLDNAALGDTPPAAAPPAPPTAKKAARTDADAPKPARTQATKPVPSRTSTTIGVYLQRPTFNAARSAYIADLDNLSTGPDTFARWIDDALAAHAGLDTSARKSIGERQQPEQRTEARGINRTFQVGQDTIDAVNAALIADRKAGHLRSRSEFAVEAILAATEAAKQRAGGVLPEAPARLPNRAMR